MTEATRLITPPAEHKPSFGAMREEYVAACNGDPCMAALLALFENWTLYRRAQEYEDWAWVTMSVEEMVFGLYGQFSASTIEGRLPLLTALGYLARRKPEVKTTDRRWQYRFDMDTVQLAVDTLFLPDALAEMTECIGQNQGMQPVDLPNALAENTECNEQNSGMHSAENANALPEIGERKLLDSLKDSFLESGDLESSSSSPLVRASTLAPSGANPDEDDDLQPTSTPIQVSVSTEPTPYALYADEIGELTPMIGERLKDAVKDFGEEAVRAAIRAASLHGARHWAYVSACLDGLRGQPPREQVYKISPEYAAFVRT